MPIEVIKVVKWHVDRGYRDPVVFGMRSARRMYAKLTAYIAKSVNEMDIQPDEVREHADVVPACLSAYLVTSLSV